MADNAGTGLEIAVIGMAGRFPGAPNIDRFWENLKNGVESITFYADEEILAAGEKPGILENPGYVKSGGGVLEDHDCFDAAFFGYSPAEAGMMDPQMRIFHECVWHALEDAGYNTAAYDGLIGLYAGASFSLTWEAFSFFSGRFDDLGLLAGSLLIDRDYLCTRVSYRLDLKGPAVAVKTACSTSLVAVHLACRSILTGECDLALAGGITVTQLSKSGYMYRQGGIGSPEGHCRAFDAGARGAVFGNGVGVVVLKRLEDAVADRDHIYAVIKGSAINNDGLRKAGYAAPSVEGQAEAIRMSLQAAEVEAESIGYIETHGTGTELGDPVEIEGLKLAFNTGKRNFCPIGSVKTNIGHLDSAAGIAGFIKTVLVLQHKQIPPSLNFETPNPRIDFANTPFYVNTKLSEWRVPASAHNQEMQRRRAGVSSFGIGGTNAHVILEEWPEQASAEVFSGVQGAVFSKKAPWLLLLSARTQPILEQMAQNLAFYFEAHPGIDPADVAYTLQVGRKVFAYKKYLVCAKVAEAIDFLKSPENKEANTYSWKEGGSRPIVFMFPGQGAQYVNMALGLYRGETVFRRELDHCCEILQPLMGVDLKEILYPPEGIDQNPASGGQGAVIDQTRVTQPLIFALEYAMAKLLLSWGIKPYAMTGHSIGEYTAACLAGVFTLEDALQITALRGRLMQGMPPGAMLSVSLPEEKLKPLLGPGISLAAVNSTANCVVSGSFAAIEKFTARLNELGCRTRPLHTSHAFHSGMMDPILAEFADNLKKIRFAAPQIPYISNATGDWITAEEAAQPGYWARHLRETVNFRDGLSRLLQEKEALFIEIGPGNVLSTFLRQHKDKREDHFAVNLVRHPHENIADEYYLANKIGQLWLYGVNIDWNAFHAGEERKRLALPLYPFERRRFVFDAAPVLSGLKMGEWRRPDMAKETGDKLEEPGKQPDKEKSTLHARPNLAKPYAAPRSEIEKQLAAIWQNFLGFQGIGIDDDFFELGGDSLNAGTIIGRMHRELGVLTPLTEIFRNPTIRELVGYIEQAAQSSYADIAAVEKKEYYALSSAQKRLFILREFEQEGTAYNMPYILSAAESLERNKLQEVFNELVVRHESLRTSFKLINEEAVQIVHEHVEFKIEYYENSISQIPQRDIVPDRRIVLLIHDFIRPFDLATAPLLRVGLIEGGDAAPYILMIDMHHIIADGISQDLLFKDFMELYTGRELSPLRMHYKDYSAWQLSPQVQQKIDSQVEYWVNEFTPEVPVLNMPTDYAREAVQSFAGNIARFELDEQETEKLKEIAHTNSVTLFMVLLAMYNIFLAKLSSQEDIVVGTVIAGRKHTDLEKIVGMFVNTLALRNYPTGEKTVTQFLQETRERTIKAFENDEYKFEDLLDKLELKRDLSRNPLFDVMLVFQNFLEADASGGPEGEQEEGLKIIPYEYEHSTARFDLTLVAFDVDKKLHFTVEYCTKLFREETITRFIHYFKNTAAAVADNVHGKILEIDIIPEQEKKLLLLEFNDTAVDFPVEKTLHGLFEDQVVRSPQRSALQFADRHLTYRQLDSDAEHLEDKIRTAGVQPGHIVGLAVDIGLAMAIGVTAILKAGGAYLPIDPDHPIERKKFILQDSSAQLLLIDRSLAEDEVKFDSPGVKTIFIDEISGRHQASAVKKSQVKSEILGLSVGQVSELSISQARSLAESPAYVIYTSGTTGRPKGVLVQHRNIVNQLYGLQKRYAFAVGLHHILLAPFTFDPSVQQIFLPLISGGKLHLTPKSLKEDPAALFFYIVSRQMGIVNTVPSLMDLLLEQTDDYKGIRFQYVILAGEVFSLGLYRKLKDRLQVETLINIYGPTEAAINTTLYECGQEETGIPIGKPLMNYKVLLLDKYLNLLPIGAVGEICISGAGIAGGYLNQPELTQERFVFNNGSNKSYKSYKSYLPGKFYKTGDLGRWLPDGNIQFLGRIDQQVKIRGSRVELEEVENQLLTHKKIKKAVVIAREYKTNSIDLCAYYVIEKETVDENPPAVEELRSFLQGKLPEYMIPSYYLQVDDIPLTTHGKVDVKALPEIGPGNIKLDVVFAPPTSEIEKTIAAIWKDVLRLEKVGIDDNFFDLGGNSLDIIKVNSRLKQVSEKGLSVVSMFKYPTIRSLAAYYAQPEEAVASLRSDRSEALERGERDRNIRRQMRRNIKKD